MAIQMTPSEWTKTHSDFKTVIDGTKFVVRWNGLQAVEIKE